MLSFQKFIRSVRFALRGIREVWAREHSFRVHIVGAVILVLLLLILRIRSTDAAVLLLVAGVVLVLELVNSIFERFLDMVFPRVGAQVRDMKDIMAGAVLIASVSALVVGVIIVFPYLRL